MNCLSAFSTNRRISHTFRLPVLMTLLASLSVFSQGASGQIVPLKGPGDFSANAILIDFDDLADNEEVTQQYSKLGVQFTPAGRSHEWRIIGSDKVRGATTISEPNSVHNNAIFPATSGNVPGYIDFSNTVTKVGMYLGNAGPRSSVVADFTAFDAAGAVIGHMTDVIIYPSVSQFVGFESVDLVPIARVCIDYGNTTLTEEIDNLMFEGPDQQGWYNEIEICCTDPLVGGQFTFSLVRPLNVSVECEPVLCQGEYKSVTISCDECQQLGCKDGIQCIIDQIIAGVDDPKGGWSATQIPGQPIIRIEGPYPFDKCLTSKEFGLNQGYGWPLLPSCPVNNVCNGIENDEYAYNDHKSGYCFRIVGEPGFTPTPTAKPTETPTPRVTSTPTPEPTDTPTPRPTDTPVPSPTPTEIAYEWYNVVEICCQEPLTAGGTFTFHLVPDLGIITACDPRSTANAYVSVEISCEQCALLACDDAIGCILGQLINGINSHAGWKAEMVGNNQIRILGPVVFDKLIDTGAAAGAALGWPLTPECSVQNVCNGITGDEQQPHESGYCFRIVDEPGMDTPTPTRTLVPTETPTPRETNTPTRTPIGGDTPTPTRTPTPRESDTPTRTPVGGTSTPTPRASQTPTATRTPLPSRTPTPTRPPLPTRTPTSRRTSTPTPRPTRTPTPTPTPFFFPTIIINTLDLNVKHLEVTQGIQNTNNTLRLAKGKRTMVRATIGLGPLTGEPVNFVRGRMEAFNADTNQKLPGLSYVNGLNYATVYRNTNREDWFQTINFFVPQQWRNGRVRFQVTVDPLNQIPEFNETNNVRNVVVRFEQTRDLHVIMTPIHYRRVNSYTGPRWPGSHYSGLYYFTLRTHPYRNVIPHTSPFSIWTKRDLETKSGFNGLLSYIDSQRFFFALASGAPLSARHYGVWNYQIPAGWYGVGYRPGSSAHGRDDPHDNKGATTMAHEEGHNSNLKHQWDDPGAPPQIGEVGINVYQTFNCDIYAPNTTSLMNYGHPRWCSPWEWTKLFNRYDKASLKADDIVEQVTGEYYIVSGWVNQASSTGELNPAEHLIGMTDASIPEATGSLRVDLVNGSGAVLYSHPFNNTATFECKDAERSDPNSLKFGVHDGPVDSTQEVSLTSFALAIPYDDETQKIRLYSDDVLVDELAASGIPYGVTVTAPNGGEILETTTPMTFTADAPAGLELTFRLMYSMDGGAHWEQLAAGFTSDTTDAMDFSVVRNGDQVECTFPFDPTQIGGTDQGRVRVLATDGVHIESDISDYDFLVPLQAPKPVIIEPVENYRIEPGSSVSGYGFAEDGEDGPLDESMLDWYVSFDGVNVPEIKVATGTADCNVENNAGSEVTLWLRAEDSNGMVGWASRTVTIAQRDKADLNIDWKVDSLDLLELSNAWGASSASSTFRCTADLEPDGVIDEKDLLQWMELRN